MHLTCSLSAALSCGLLAAACSGGGGGGGGGAPPTAPQLQLEVVASHPHDPQASAEGLLYHQGKLYESTGTPGSGSSLRRVDPVSGQVEQLVSLESPLFGEGIALVGDQLLQLTWLDGRALIWTRDGFQRLGEHRYGGEGWGLGTDGQRLVMSDGTDKLVFRDPRTFQPLGELLVTRDGQPQRQLNELEWVGGTIWANLWQEELIVRIDASSGLVTGWVDPRGLLTAQERAQADVCSGIAWVPERSSFYLTGKRWPRLFEVRFSAGP